MNSIIKEFYMLLNYIISCIKKENEKLRIINTEIDAINKNASSLPLDVISDVSCFCGSDDDDDNQSSKHQSMADNDVFPEDISERSTLREYFENLDCKREIVTADIKKLENFKQIVLEQLKNHGVIKNRFLPNFIKKILGKKLLEYIYSTSIAKELNLKDVIASKKKLFTSTDRISLRVELSGVELLET